MGKRGKTVTEHKKAKVLSLLEQYSVDYVAKNQDISPSEVRTIRRVARRKEEQKQLEEAQALFKAQLCVPAPETVLIDDYGEPGHHSIPLSQDVFRVIWQDLGYDISQFRVYKESSGMPSGDVEVNVAVSHYGTLELCYPVEEHPSFQDLLSSLPEVTREQLYALKLDGGTYLTKCNHIRREIHKEARESTYQLLYEVGTQLVPWLQHSVLPPLTPSFANLIYQLCILYRRTRGEYGLPDKSWYQIRDERPPFGGLYLGEIHLANAPNPPPFPFTELPHILEGWIDLHREMIMKWSASPDIIQLLELFESLRGIEGAIKVELDHRDSKR